VTDQFIRERRYLKGVTPKTEAWYKDSFHAFEGALDTLDAIKTRIVELSERGVKPVSINTYLRAVKAYCRWRELDWKIPRLKEEQKILQTLSDVQVRALINFKPKGAYQARGHALMLTVLDTGLRATEALSITKESVDMDNLAIRVVGKGGKHRLVPFSSELRKSLYRHFTKVTGRYLFKTKYDTKLTVRNFDRDLKVIGKACGITGVRFSPHTLRHTFAASWLRRGGDIYLLSRCLGHSSLKTTEVYLKSLGIADIARVHAQVSLLSR